MTDSKGELENDSKENFHDCFEGEDDIIANVDTHDEFRDGYFVWK